MPQAVIGALRVNLSANTAAFDRNMSAADRRLSQFSRNVMRTAAVLGTAVIGGLSALTVSSLRTIDAQAKLAQQTGASVASIQTLQHAGELAGVSIQEMAGNLQRMNRRLGEVISSGSGPAARTLEQLGLKAEDIVALDMDERIAVIADAMQQLGSEAEMSAAAFQIFGDAGLRMVPLLAAGGDAIRSARQELEDFGVLLSEEAAAQVEAANDAVTNLKLAFTGLGNTLAVQVAPKIEAVADSIGDFIKENDGLIDGVIKAAEVIGGALAGGALALLGRAAIGAGGAIGGLVTALRAGTASAATFSAALGPIGLLVGGITAAIALFAGGHDQAKSAADLHREALEQLRGEIQDAIDQGPEAVAALAADKEGQLQAAQAALVNATAQWEAARAIEARVLAEAGGVVPERRVEDDPAVAAILAQIEALRELEITAANLTGGAGGGDVPVIVDPDQAQRELDTLRQSLASARDLIIQEYGERSRIIRENLEAGNIEQEEAAALLEQVQRDKDKALLELARDNSNKIREVRNEGYGGQLADLQAALDAELAAVEAAEAAKLAARQSAISAWAGVFGDLANLIKDEGEKQFKIAKALSIAEAIINTAQGVTKALASSPPPWNFVQAAAVAAAGLVQIATIKRQQPNGSGSVASPGQAPAAGPNLNQTLTVHGATADQIFNGLDARRLSEKLLDFQRDGGRVVFA